MLTYRQDGSPARRQPTRAAVIGAARAPASGCGRRQPADTALVGRAPADDIALRVAARAVAVLAVVVVFFQIGVVSEVPVFGVNVDLSPLLVAFIGLLCGSTIGA